MKTAVGVSTAGGRDGWHQIGDLPSLAAVDENDIEGSEFDAAASRAMQALGMSQERLEFLA